MRAWPVKNKPVLSINLENSESVQGAEVDSFGIRSPKHIFQFDMGHFYWEIYGWASLLATKLII